MKKRKLKVTIKTPTIANAKARGFIPTSYHTSHGIACGWIYKETNRFIYFFAPSTGKKRVPVSERRFMRAL